jgi:EAL domain-containing protein (putative c-di-GMP-specific phosphodiesterase class I)/HPt (histidine-containing phosphotransfer) domain-containing protein
MIDPDMLRQLNDMAAAGRSDFVERVCGLYLEHAVKTHDELEQAMASADLETIGQTAHALKSMSYNIGARQVAEAAAAIETTARGEGAQPTPEQCQKLAAVLERTLADVRAILQPAAETPASVPEPQLAAPGPAETAAAEPDMAAALRQAMLNKELWVAYQPIVSRMGDATVGVEALVRWGQGKESIPPGIFIPVAEQAGLIQELGSYVLRQACADAASWPNITVAVNLSALQLREPDFVETVERTLKQTGMDPRRLELEITEGILLEFGPETLAKIERLRSMGISFALDDFGTGYASLTYLRRCSFEKIKIDRSFVDGIESLDAAAIVHAVTSIGRALGMKVVAEGVETAEQHRFLAAAGVHMIQGYLFGRPMTASDISQRLTGERDTITAALRAAQKA